MDFFGYQEKAKKRSFWLFALFLTGMILITSVLNIIADAILAILGFSSLNLHWFHFFFPVVSVTVILSFLEYARLKSGGRAVAESMAARLVDQNSNDFHERRLLNVVEEMAIAAGVPVPPVYLLDHELNINAFAAGFSINDAVIGVTAGTVKLLNREELQAVIGHEFSHIVHEDTKTVLRFSALLYGLFCISELGYMVIRGTFPKLEKHSSSNVIYLATISLALGSLFIMTGWLSRLWAKLMQAAITRQREYLADAASVQFTRQGDALASALKKIGGSATGSTLELLSSESYAHLFFGATIKSFLSSHPPLEKRIQRLQPAWNGHYIKPDLSLLKAHTSEPHQTRRAELSPEAALAILSAGTVAAAAVQGIASSGLSDYEKDKAQNRLNRAAAEPLDACCLVLAMLLDEDHDIRNRQLETFRNSALISGCRNALDMVGKERGLRYLEKAVPALKTLSANQYAGFKKAMVHLIGSGSRFSLPQWLLFRMITRQIGRQYDAKTSDIRTRYTHIEEIREAAQTLLSAIARLSYGDIAAKRAFGSGANAMGLYSISLQPEPGLSALGLAMKKLDASSDAVKRKFLNGAFKAICRDGVITADESLFYKTLSLCLDQPAPPSETAAPANQ